MALPLAKHLAARRRNFNDVLAEEMAFRDRQASAWKSKLQAIGYTAERFHRMFPGREGMAVVGMTLNPEANRLYMQFKEAKRSVDRHAEVAKWLAKQAFKFTRRGDTLEIQLRGEIRPFAADAVDEELDDRLKAIRLEIDSPGGLSEETYAIIAALQATGATIKTHAVGQCGSAANLLLCAGSTRTAHPSATFQFHGTQLIRDGVNVEPEVAADLMQVEAASDRYADFVSQATGHTRDEVRLWMDCDRQFDAKWAAAVGLVDQIFDTDAAQQAAAEAVMEMQQRLADSVRDRVDREKRRREVRQEIESLFRYGERSHGPVVLLGSGVDSREQFLARQSEEDRRTWFSEFV